MAPSSNAAPALRVVRSWSALLPLGYLYLLAIGIVNRSIHYAFIGINIIGYSDLLDVLLSPIALMTGSVAILILTILTPAVLYPTVLLSRRHAQRKNPDSAKRGLLAWPILDHWLSVSAVALFGAFVGMGVGSGFATSQRLAAGELDPGHRITFTDGSAADVHIIGNNSRYLFYVAENTSRVVIAPIQNNLRTLEPLENEPEIESGGDRPAEDESESASTSDQASTAVGRVPQPDGSIPSPPQA